MGIKRFFILLSLFLFFLFLVPKGVKAVDVQEMLTSENSIVVKVQEGIEYFFAFKVVNKIAVLEKHAEKRLVMAQGYAEEGNNERVRNVLQNYMQIKERQDNLLEGINDGEVLGMVEERTIEQQRTMEEIKTVVVNTEVKQEVVQVQERVVNQVAQRVVEVNGKEGQTEFFEKVEHVWAPGTGPGGEAGVVIEGGTMQFAPGTSAGGPSGVDVSNVVIEGDGGGGGSGNEVKEGDGGSNLAPGTSAGSGSTVDIEE